MVTKLKADLFSIGSTSLVVTDGFAFKATNDACVKVVDGSIMATKFGLKTASPSYVKKTKQEAKEYGEEMYNKIKKDLTLHLYYGDKYYIPTVLDRPFCDQKEYAVHDNEKDRVYQPKYDDIDHQVYNLVGVRGKTIQKVDTDEFKSKMNERYVPLVGIKNSQI